MQNSIKKIKILMTGGGTGGPVTPLLAVIDTLRKSSNKYEFLWIGTSYGPERDMVEQKRIVYYQIASGKWRRYFSIKNIFDIFNIIIGFFQSIIILFSQKPDLVMSAGGFVSVPTVWAAWLLQTPVFIHQQDLVPGLANKIMAPFASVISVTFEKSLSDYGQKAVWTGNPVREEFKDMLGDANKNKAYELFGLNPNLPVILVVGGGTGSLALNMLVTQSLPYLAKHVQLIHVTGAKKSSISPLKWVDSENSASYKKFEYLDAQKMSFAVQVADVVVSRCGMGFLTELSYLSKASILIPLPDSQQVINGDFFRENEAAIVLDQNSLDSDEFIRQIRNVLHDEDLRHKIQSNINSIIKKNAALSIVELIEKIPWKN
jgi:UDP-N-acetylglucosamine--N-acetylmuramyl-(pentapeptide) pyrophosphoryl-undecaprenol N-acetylglucosamine transferase